MIETIKLALNPYLAVIKIALLVAAVCAVFAAGAMWNGKRVAAKYEAEKAAAIKAEIKQGNQAAQGLEVKKDERNANHKANTQYVDKIVYRDIYRNLCLDDDGLSVVNSALKGGVAAKPDSTMQKP